MNLLVTAIGKRVQLIEHLKQNFTIIGVDVTDMAPAKSFVDTFHFVPPCNHPDYVNALVTICRNEQVSLLIPLYEEEFDVLSENRERFSEIGTHLLLSDQRVLDICSDKWSSHQFFTENGIDTPKGWNCIEEIDAQFPLLIKPRSGMGSANVHKIENSEELAFYGKRVENPIIQEFIEGTEYTIDCLCDKNGQALSIVPRERIEIIAGEVSKTRTVHDSDVMKATHILCNKLKGVGPLTIQCIKTDDGRIVFLEVNPRFGGGVPATFAAGINYASIIRAMETGETLPRPLMSFKETTMLRYSEAVFV